MKKTILIVGLVVLAIGVLGVGVAFAQGSQPPVGSGMNGGRGLIHDYVEKALAAKLGITEAEVESALASGKTMYQTALDNGVKEADVPAMLAEVHKTAFDKAVADGIITRAQADFMLQRMTANGYGSGNCPMQNGQGGGYGRGNGYGSGMMSGGRWQQQPPTVQQ